MSGLKTSIDDYTKNLIFTQQAITSYSQSIGGLLQAVQLLDDETTKKKCHRILSIAINEVIEIQRILTQKELLLKAGAYPQPIFLQDPAHTPSIHAHQPTLVKSIAGTPSSSNMVNYYLQNPFDYQGYKLTKTKSATPLKPWLSDKVYKNSYINKGTPREE